MQFDWARDLTKGKKMIALSECGNIPDPAKSLSDVDNWSWFLVWYTLKQGELLLYDPNDGDFKLNTLSHWTKVMVDPNVITRDAMPWLK